MSEHAEPNSDQIEFWNSDAAGRWVTSQEAMDVTLAAFSDALLAAAAVQPGAAAIDIGCGCGATTLDLARRVGPMGRVLAVDISTPMLRRAQERAAAENLGHVTFVNADASTYRFEEGRADNVISRFGVMFFRNNDAAFANIRRALRPEGGLAFVCWRGLPENEWVTVPRDVALRHLAPPEPPKPGEPGPFAFADRDRVTGILASAGFTGIDFQPLDLPMRQRGTVAEVAENMTRMGPASRLMADISEEVKARIVADLEAEIASRHDGEGVDLAGAAWVVTARA